MYTDYCTFTPALIPQHGFNVGFDGMLEKQKAVELKIAHCLTESSLTAGDGERAIQPQK